ncbi:hypothetical protein J7L97_02540 [Candidatus Bathyarchaeota archaeon]|nr:hypothetical protein [Candidatus Bathyarchaeota archaeon]
MSFDLDKVREIVKEEVKKAFSEGAMERTIHHELEEVMWQFMYERIDQAVDRALREIIGENAKGMAQKIIDERSRKVVEEWLRDKDIFDVWEVREALRETARSILEKLDLSEIINKVRPELEKEIQGITREFIESNVRSEFRLLVSTIEDLQRRISNLELKITEIRR